MSKTFSVADVASHKDASSGMYIIVDENVYDVTSMLIFPLPWSLSPYCPIVTSPLHLSCPCAADLYPLPCFQSLLSKTDFVDEHPGGAKILKRVAGKDATKQFWKYHNESVLKKYAPKLKIGTVAEKAKL
jgi:cytochrome b involved in lipid metabolism